MTLTSRGESIIIDAGSGLMLLEAEMKDKPRNILISHLHLDHIIGLGIYSPLWQPKCDVRVYTCSRDERPLKEQVFGCFTPPYWPSSLAEVSDAICVPVESGVPFNIEHFTITPIMANHADKTLSFHITDGEKSVAHLLDNEFVGMEKRMYQELLDICTGADLVIFDSAYSTADYPSMKGRGHSTVEQGVKFAQECKPKRMMFAHYCWHYDDAEIDSWKKHTKGATDCEFIFSRDGVDLAF